MFLILIHNTDNPIASLCVLISALASVFNDYLHLLASYSFVFYQSI